VHIVYFDIVLNTLHDGHCAKFMDIKIAVSQPKMVANKHV